jgi:uncharacterized protein (DUF488 family)
MIFDRQKRLLALLDTHGGEVNKLDFQKLLFLYCVNIERIPSYEFVPYKFGGFSFTSYADKRRLTENGLLADTEHTWKLTGAGKAAAKVNSATRTEMHRFAKQYEGLRGNALVAAAYRQHPYYAIRSEIVGRVLRRDASSLAAVESARPHPGKAGICTIGYEGRSLEAYLNLLLKSGVTVLCDVRRNPLSRKYGFSKGTLSSSCAGVGIRYEHLPELGIDGQRRRELETQADYDALFADYKRDDLPKQQRALKQITAWVNKGERVALTCYESLPRQCHRHCVAEALERIADRDWCVEHL